MSSRFMDPRAAGDTFQLRKGRVPILPDVQAENRAARRFSNPGLNPGRIIGVEVNDAADQTITSTTAVAINGTEFALGLGGPRGLRWIVDLEAFVWITLWGAAGDVARLQFQVSFDDGVNWESPETNLTEQGAGGVWAFYTSGLAQGTGASNGVQVTARICFFALPTDQLKVRLAAQVNTGDSATIELTSSTFSPRIVGKAIAVQLED